MRIEQLPKVVQEYFKKVCNDANNYADDDIYPLSRLLRIEQKGQFLLMGTLYHLQRIKNSAQVTKMLALYGKQT